MELIDGVTLGAYVARSRRRWREIVAVMLAAGEGLYGRIVAGKKAERFTPQERAMSAVTSDESRRRRPATSSPAPRS